MDPVTIAIGASLVSSFIGGVGSYQEGKEKEAQAKLNAQIAELAAKDAILRGEHEANVQRMRTSEIIGKQRQSYGASGVSVESGNAVDVVGDTAMIGELDAQMIMNNARREAWGYKVRAISNLQEGEAASRRGTYGAIGSVLGGIGDVAGLKARS